MELQHLGSGKPAPVHEPVPDAFSAGDNAMGGTWANIFRALTIALTIAGTIWYKRRKGLPLEVNGSNLWMKNGTES